MKSNRKLNYKGKQHTALALATMNSNDFDDVTVEGKVYQVWTSNVTLPGISDESTGKPKGMRILISQQKLQDDKWSDYFYLLTTDRSMGKWTTLFLYRKRWKIETFYQFAKNAFDFRGSQIRSETGALRYFILLFLLTPT